MNGPPAIRTPVCRCRASRRTAAAGTEFLRFASRCILKDFAGFILKIANVDKELQILGRALSLQTLRGPQQDLELLLHFLNIELGLCLPLLGLAANILQ